MIAAQRGITSSSTGDRLFEPGDSTRLTRVLERKGPVFPLLLYDLIDLLN